MIRKYQDAVVGEVTRYDGQVAQYLGDGVLAYFCFPMAHEDDAERGVRAALATLSAVASVGSPVGENLAVRIGIASGIVVAGDLVGEGAAREHSVVGGTPLLRGLKTSQRPGRWSSARARVTWSDTFSSSGISARSI